jgi:glutaredoxin 3
MTSLADFLARKATVTFFTTTGCPYCARALALLEQLGVRAPQLLVIQRADGAKAFAEIESKYGHNTFPAIFVQQEFVGGNSDLQELHKAGKLVPKLQSKQ